MNQIIDLIKGFIIDIVKAGENRVMISFYNLKRKVFRFALELIFMTLGLLFMVIGAVMVVDNYLPLEWVLLVTGLVMFNIVMLMAKFR